MEISKTLTITTWFLETEIQKYLSQKKEKTRQEKEMQKCCLIGGVMTKTWFL